MQKNTENQPGGEILLYQTEDGRTRIECRFEDNTLWLTQARMAKLFQTTPQNITLHLKAIYADHQPAGSGLGCGMAMPCNPAGGNPAQITARHGSGIEPCRHVSNGVLDA